MRNTTFTRQDVARVVRQLRLQHVDNPPVVATINRAAFNLDGACLWQFTDDRLVIESATQTGRRSYEVTASGCTCAAAAASRLCWHIMAWRILTEAQQAVTVASTPTVTSTFEALTADVDEWFA